MSIKTFLEQKLLSDKDFLVNSLQNNDTSRQSVWHAIQFEHVAGILDSMELKPFTKQRYWPDGHRYKDNHPEYENSRWMYGWSTTRNKEYAMGWNCVVFELDIDKIKQQFEVKPFAWNFLFNHKTNNRKEHEEFIVAAYSEKSLPEMKLEDEMRDIEIDNLYRLCSAEEDPIKKAAMQETIDKLWDVPSYMNRWNESLGKSIDLSKCLKGIYMSKFSYELRGDQRVETQQIVNHPLFKGFFVDPVEKQQNISKSKFKP